jgi:hypothetical protein
LVGYAPSADLRAKPLEWPLRARQLPLGCECWVRRIQYTKVWVFKILDRRGPLTPTEILPELRRVTLRGAALHKEPLTPGTLKKKMDVRVAFGRYFKSCDEGRYARRVG